MVSVPYPCCEEPWRALVIDNVYWIECFSINMFKASEGNYIGTKNLFPLVCFWQPKWKHFIQEIWGSMLFLWMRYAYKSPYQKSWVYVLFELHYLWEMLYLSHGNISTYLTEVTYEQNYSFNKIFWLAHHTLHIWNR